jgi:hypothetical protein
VGPAEANISAVRGKAASLPKFSALSTKDPQNDQKVNQTTVIEIAEEVGVQGRVPLLCILQQ